MIDIWDSIDVMLASYRDQNNRNLLQRFKEEYYLTLNAEADARRSKASTIIKDIARLKIELKKFEYTYSLVKIKTGDITAVENMINSLNHKIKAMLIQKNRLS